MAPLHQTARCSGCHKIKACLSLGQEGVAYEDLITGYVSNQELRGHLAVVDLDRDVGFTTYRRHTFPGPTVPGRNSYGSESHQVSVASLCNWWGCISVYVVNSSNPSLT